MSRFRGTNRGGLSPSQLRKPLTATPLARIPVFSVVWVLHSSWRWRGRAKQTTIRSPALSDIRVDETRDVYFPFVVMWIQRRQAAGYTAPDDDEGVASRAKAPLPSPGRKWWCSHGSLVAGSRRAPDFTKRTVQLPGICRSLSASFSLTNCTEARRSCQGI